MPSSRTPVSRRAASARTETRRPDPRRRPRIQAPAASPARFRIALVGTAHLVAGRTDQLRRLDRPDRGAHAPARRPRRPRAAGAPDQRDGGTRALARPIHRRLGGPLELATGTYRFGPAARGARGGRGPGVPGR